jgi:hypothetical protein
VATERTVHTVASGCVYSTYSYRRDHPRFLISAQATGYADIPMLKPCDCALLYASASARSCTGPVATPAFETEPVALLAAYAAAISARSMHAAAKWPVA